MTYEDVLAFVRENPICTVATMDGDQPRVRWFLSLLFDDGKIYFTTGATKSVFGQISKNPKVELCFIKGDFSRMLRIAGKIEVVDDLPKKQKLVQSQDYLKGYRADDPILKLLRVSHGTARFWTMQDNMKENALEQIIF